MTVLIIDSGINVGIVVLDFERQLMLGTEMHK